MNYILKMTTISTNKTFMFSFRLNENLKIILTTLSKSYKLSVSKLIQMLILEGLKNTDLQDLELNGINFNNILKEKQKEDGQKIIKYMRSRFMSKTLFMNRVKQNTIKLIFYNKTPSQIKELLGLYLLEAEYFSENKEVLAEMKLFLGNYEQEIIKLKNMMLNNITTNTFEEFNNLKMLEYIKKGEKNLPFNNKNKKQFKKNEN